MLNLQIFHHWISHWVMDCHSQELANCDFETFPALVGPQMTFFQHFDSHLAEMDQCQLWMMNLQNFHCWTSLKLTNSDFSRLLATVTIHALVGPQMTFSWNFHVPPVDSG